MIRRGIKRPTLEEWERILTLLKSEDSEIRLLGASSLNTFSVANKIIHLCYIIAKNPDKQSYNFSILKSYIKSTTNES